MPAMNTPQFTWVKSRLPRMPQPVPPIYEPEVGAASSACRAYVSPRREYWVGGSTVKAILGQKLFRACSTSILERQDTARSNARGGFSGPPQ